MIQRTFLARQYLHADQQVCIVAVNGHIISIEARATAAPHPSSAARTVRSANDRRGVQTDRTSGRQPDDAGGNRRVVGLQPRTGQPSLWIEGRASSRGDRTPAARFCKDAGARAGGAARNGSPGRHGRDIFAQRRIERSQRDVRVDRRGARAAPRDSRRDGRGGQKIPEVGAEADRGGGASSARFGATSIPPRTQRCL